MRPTASFALVAIVLSASSACAHRALVAPTVSHPVTIAALRAAPSALAEAGSGRFEMHTIADGLEAAGEVTSAGVFARGVLAMDLDLGAVLTQAAHGSGRSVPSAFDGQSRIVIDGSTVYVRIPMLHELTGEPGWLSMTSAELGAQGPGGFQASALDPVRMVDTLRGVVGEVQEVGHDTVRGVSTTHVTSTLSAGQEMEVWIDAEHLVRRLRFVVDGVRELGAVTTTIELFDYGVPIDVDVPGPGEAIAFADLVREFMSAGV